MELDSKRETLPKAVAANPSADLTLAPMATETDLSATGSFNDRKPPTPGKPTAGQTGSGRYRLDVLLGKGGFGEVWKGYDPVLDLVVAIKVPRSDRAFSQAESDQFVDEARKQAKLNHPAIVKIRHAEREADAWLIVSDLIDGTSLREALQGRKFAPAECAQLVAAIADALDYAHRQRLIHRDVKPANILLDRAGRPYLADFGLALSEDQQQGEKNSVAGTYPYMAPEQIRGETHFLDGRADIYSLGVVLYELLTGERPFRGVGVEEYREQIVSRPPKPPRAIDASIPKELERICLKCLAKSAGERYSTAADLAEDLRRSVTPRRRWPWVLAALCFGAALVALGLFLFFRADPEPREERVRDDDVLKSKEKPKDGTNPPPSVLPQAEEGRVQLWSRAPTKLVWPTRGSLLDVKAQEESIWAICDGDGLFKIGDVGAASYVFRVNVKMPRDAMFGVALGFHYVQENGVERAKFEMLRLTPSPVGKARYLFGHYSVVYNLEAGGLPVGVPLAHAPIDDLPARACPLEISIVDDRLASVSWDGRELPALLRTKSETKSNWRGGICLYVRAGTFQFHRPELELKTSKQ